MSAIVATEPPPFDGCPGPAPGIVVTVTLSGLTPEEVVSLPGTAAYEFATLGCGVEPSSCVWGSDTTDPDVRLCRPEHAEAVAGATRASAEATAEADGTAVVTLRFVIPESQRQCPAGTARPWYLESGGWKVRVTDAAHGLRLVGGQDELSVGP